MSRNLSRSTFQPSIGFWERIEPEDELMARMSLRAPDGEELAAMEPVATALEKPRLRTVWNIQGMIYKGPGRYTVALQTKDGSDEDGEWSDVAEIPIQINETDASPASADA